MNVLIIQVKVVVKVLLRDVYRLYRAVSRVSGLPCFVSDGRERKSPRVSNRRAGGSARVTFDGRVQVKVQNLVKVKKTIKIVVEKNSEYINGIFIYTRY